MMQDEHIHESFLKETVFVVSPLNYMVYKSGYKACERAEPNYKEQAEKLAGALDKVIMADHKNLLTWYCRICGCLRGMPHAKDCEELLAKELLRGKG